MDEQVAVFIDFENVAISAETTYGKCELGPIIESAEKWGRCILKRAYGDWTRFAQYRHELLTLSIELVQMFHYGGMQRKNGADIQMVVDALETAFVHTEIDTFVLVTGDSDFSAVARKLRAYGKQVVGIGLRQATSEVLVKACDHFVLYDTLIEPSTRSLAHMREQARRLLVDALKRLETRAGEGGVLGAQLKHAMLRQDRAFNELSLGFDQFRAFLEAESEVVEVEHREGSDLVVRLRPMAQALDQDEVAPYRTAIEAANLTVMDAHTREETLRDLYTLVRAHPGRYTYEEAVLELKARYDTTNVLRSLDEVRQAARLIRLVEVIAPPPQSWELDKLSLAPELAAQEWVDQCESAYVAAILGQNLALKPDVVALLLFGTTDKRARVERLAELVQGRATKGGKAPILGGQEWSALLQERPALEIVFQDVESQPLDETPSVERASERHSLGLENRSFDFEGACGHFMQAAAMARVLFEQGTPGASFIDVKWYLASYSAASAGAHFFRYNYTLAAKYYLAFFALAQEVEPVWDRVSKLVPAMLSYYFTIAANEAGQRLEDQPGRTRPAQMAVTLYSHPHPGVSERWCELVRDLKAVNPALLRSVLQQVQALKAMDKEHDVPGAEECLSRTIEEG